MNMNEPVLIVGAPRSGTSLLQQILREHDGFRSVAKESEFIWRSYTHPTKNDWQYEGWRKSVLENKDRNRILAEFDRYAFSARTWRRAAAFNIMGYHRSPLLAPLLRGSYRLGAIAASLLRRRERSDFGQYRIVDKSVNSPLFLPLVEQVFPNARFIHIVRNAFNTVPSMLEGWLTPTRFFTFDVPGGLAIPDYPYQSWNFALPAGWQQWRNEKLADVVSFQWLALQENVIKHFDQFSSRPMLRIRLENLVAEPEKELHELANFVGLPQTSYLKKLSRGLPLVNARPARNGKNDNPEVAARMSRLSNDQWQRLKQMNENLGYP